MKNKNSLTLNEALVIIEKSKEYDNETATNHIIELGERREILNQTCRSEADLLRLERINRTYDLVRDIYSKKTSEFSLEDSNEMMRYNVQLHTDMLQLEQKQKEYVTDDEE